MSTTREILNKLYGVNVLEEDDPTGTTTVTTTPTRILPNNPGGLQVTIINTGSNDLNLWTDNSVSATKGIRIAANGGSYEIDFTRFGTMPTREWWAVALSSTTTVSVKRTTIV